MTARDFETLQIHVTLQGPTHTCCVPLGRLLHLSVPIKQGFGENKRSNACPVLRAGPTYNESASSPKYTDGFGPAYLSFSAKGGRRAPTEHCLLHPQCPHSGYHGMSVSRICPSRAVETCDALSWPCPARVCLPNGEVVKQAPCEEYWSIGVALAGSPNSSPSGCSFICFSGLCNC